MVTRGGRRSARPRTDVPVQALQLLGRWTRVARGHIALASGCGCGFAGAMNFSAADLEPEVLDFLRNRFGADPAIAKVFADIGHHDGRTGRIADLLGALARPGAHPRAAVDLLAHLASSIDSFEDAHGGRR